ncbi:hypothetical protein Tco_0763919 [Tanacetum coccineum]
MSSSSAPTDTESILSTGGAQGSPIFTPSSNNPYMLVRKAYSPTTPNIESKPFEDPLETEDPQPLSPTLAHPSLDYTSATPHTDDESESFETSETRVTSSPSPTPPADPTSPPSPQRPLLAQASPTPTPPRPFYYHCCNQFHKEVLDPFRKICVWKKAVGFLGSLPVPLQHMEWKPDSEGNFGKKEEGDGQWHAEIRLTDPYGNVYDQASSGQEKEVKVLLSIGMEEEDETLFHTMAMWRITALTKEKNGEKLVKRELLVSLKGEFYFVKFIINPKDDDVEKSVILGRSFMRLAKGIADFVNRVITLHPELDPFLDNSEETEKFKDDWDNLLDIDFGDIPEIDEAGLPPFICKIGKSKRNKKRALENF